MHHKSIYTIHTFCRLCLSFKSVLKFMLNWNENCVESASIVAATASSMSFAQGSSENGFYPLELQFISIQCNQIAQCMCMFVCVWHFCCYCTTPTSISLPFASDSAPINAWFGVTDWKTIEWRNISNLGVTKAHTHTHSICICHSAIVNLRFNFSLFSIYNQIS